MKKVLLCSLLLGSLLSNDVLAQESGRFRFGWDFGFAKMKNGVGISYSVEPKINIADNMSVGVKIGGAALAREIDDINPILKQNGVEFDYEIGINTHCLATFDYYVHSGGSLAPYFGIGAGLTEIADLESTIIINDVKTKATDKFDNKFGMLLRAGFEAGKFRMGVEYMYIKKEKFYDDNGTEVGNMPNSYLNIHLGFFLGGGKWN